MNTCDVKWADEGRKLQYPAAYNLGKEVPRDTPGCRRLSPCPPFRGSVAGYQTLQPIGDAMPDDFIPDMDQIAVAVASVTGIKQQFVDAGWTNGGAEEITIAMFNKGS